MIQIFPDYETLSREAAARIISLGMSAIVERDRFDLVLSGGDTPRRCYEILAERLREEPEFWRDTHVFWGDERCVRPDDPASNYGRAKETLLDVVKAPAKNVHRIRAESADLEAAAAAYAESFPVFPDLLLLGMGADGHTASLFAGSSALDEREKRFVVVEASVDPKTRITMAPPAIFAARTTLMLVSGPEKAEALQRVFGDGDVRETPAALVCEATWFVTNDAMG